MGKYSGFLTQMKNERPWLLDDQVDAKGHLAHARSKFSGFLKKFKSYQFLSYVNLYLDLLDGMVPASPLF